MAHVKNTKVFKLLAISHFNHILLYKNNEKYISKSDLISQVFKQCTREASTYLEHACCFNVLKTDLKYRRTKIICTIGPASREVPVLEKMIATGMNIARLNFSHGSHEYHAETLDNIREATENYSEKICYKYSLAIALDTKGPEIRSGVLEGGKGSVKDVALNAGEMVTLTVDEQYMEKCTNKMVYVDYKNIVNIVKEGTIIFVDDGLIGLKVEKIEATSLECRILNSSNLGSQKGINIPGHPTDLPAVSEKDKCDLKFGVEQNVDMIFASFIRTAAAVEEIRGILGEKGKRILIIPKIESTEGVQNLDEIIEASDGLMVARGDLGIEIPIEQIFLAQKTAIARCNRLGKPAICATQMLDSMIVHPKPTRAESTDVANAVLDGADMVMLSGETAKGKYPIECIQMMSKICQQAEAAIWLRELFVNYANEDITSSDSAISLSAAVAALKSKAVAIIVICQSGRTARLIAKYRPTCVILAVTRDDTTARQFQLTRGIIPILYEIEELCTRHEEVEAQIQYAFTYGKDVGIIKAKDYAVVVTGCESETKSNSLGILYRYVNVVFPFVIFYFFRQVP